MMKKFKTPTFALLKHKMTWLLDSGQPSSKFIQDGAGLEAVRETIITILWFLGNMSSCGIESGNIY